MKIDQMLHKLFGTTPGKGVQPKEAIAYSVAGFGQNFICTIIGSYLTIFLTDALLFGADGVNDRHYQRLHGGRMAHARLPYLRRPQRPHHGLDSRQDPHQVGQMPPLSQVDGVPHRIHDHRLLPARSLTQSQRPPLSSFPLFTFFGALFIPLRMSPIGVCRPA